jgi:stage II sporulation protein P
LKVGDAFTKALEKNGLTVIHATDSHIPHDNMAYERSRRTAARLVKEQPAAIFDLHRDATPPEAYQGEVNGEAITQVQLVVGKYGPTGKQIEDYALQIKKAADEEYPGLVKGIFFAKGGDYNQDLHAHSMLLEVGSHTNDRHQAQRGIELFANVVPKVLNIKSAEAAPSETLANSAYAQKEETGAYKSAMYILLAFLGGTIIYVYVGSGSMAEARSKAVHFFTREFNDVFGKKKK